MRRSGPGFRLAVDPPWTSGTTAGGDETGRLAALADLDLLDTQSEALFDRFTKLASEMFSVPIAIVSLVADDRQWFKSCIGLAVDGTPRKVAFCDHAIRDTCVMVVPDATADPRFADNPLVTGDPGIRFYAGAPLITPTGYKIGTLCIIDRAPRPTFGVTEASMLETLAGAVMATMGLRNEALARQRLADELSLARTEAQASADRYRRLADNTSDIVSETDAHGRFTYLSSAVTAVSGFSVDEVMQRPALDLVHPEDLDRVEREIATILSSGRAGRIEYRHIRKDGTVLWLESRPTPMIDPITGKILAVRDVTRDVTARKAYEGLLVAARDAAVSATQAKSDFLSNMSHEIRTPLNSIIGFAGLLERMPELSPAARTYSQRIVTGGDALLLVVNDILDLARIESGQLLIEDIPFDLKTLVLDAIDMTDVNARAKELEVGLQWDPDVPEVVLGDPARLRQILLNYLTNAIKFTGSGSIMIGVRRCPDALDMIRLSVSDTGIGIPKDRHDALFNRFEQADSSVSRLYGGTGLGLAIVKQLAEKMRGRVGVDSKIGTGSTFWLELPAPEAELALTPEPPAELSGGADAVRILLVDDLPVNRELIRTVLAPYDVVIQEAENGIQAVQVAGRVPFDLILMDIQMPGMDGLEATRAIRLAPGPNTRTPIVALSANTLPAHLEAARLAGMSDHIAKPFDIGRLIEHVSYWCRQSGESWSNGPENGHRV